VEAVHLADPTLARLLDYWQERRAGRLVPLWSAIDPVEIPWALRYVWVCDFDLTTRRFIYRLSGEDINSVYGFNLRGRSLEEIFSPAGREGIYRRYLETVQKPAIIVVRGRIYLRSNRLLKGERLMLPMSRTGKAVDMVLGATVCADTGKDFHLSFGDIPQREQETEIIPLAAHARAAAACGD
jgi:hypothetical protein